MSKFLLKILSLVLVLITVSTIAPAVNFTASAAQMTLAEMQKKYPHGKYWNGKDPESYTSTPCTHHKNQCSYDGSCGCATYKNYAIQCMGFAFQLAYTAYGGEPYIEWEVDYNATSALKNLKPGDVIRYNYNGHSAFVYGVSGDTVTFADCNYQNNCVIRWGGTITKTKLKESFTSVAKAPYSLAENHKHSYTSGYDTTHPHNEYKKCKTCGYSYYTGQKKSSSNCNECANGSGEKVVHPLPIKGIPLSGKTTTVYSSVNGSAKSQKLGGNGICFIQELYENGWCKIDYTDTSGASQSGFIKSNEILADPTYQPFKITATEKVLTYARGDLSEEIGYTVAGDVSYIVGYNTKAAQILYPISGGGHRAAWIYLDNLSLSFTPIWKVNTLTVFYSANGGVISSDKYKVKNDMVYSASDGKKLEDLWTFNTKKSEGLIDPADLGLTKAGYTFNGWSATPHGDKIFDPANANLLPTDLNPSLTNNSCYTVLYAIWEPILPKVTALSIATRPKKSVYSLGEVLDLSGLSLKVQFADGTSATITEGFTVGPFINNSVGNKILSVKYGDKEVNLSLMVAASVNGATPMPNFLNCHHSSFKAVSTTPASCSTLGQSSFQCGLCGGIKTISIPTLPHTVAVTEAVKPTCTKSGKSEGLYCSVCNSEIENASIHKKLGHSYKNKVTKKATTEKTGRLKKTCKRCGYKKTTKIKRIAILTLSKTSYTVSSKSRKPSVTVLDSVGAKLKKGTDYTLKYESGRKSVGEYKVTVSFKGKYKGKSYLYFKIKPKGTSLGKISGKTKGLKVRWISTKKNTSGYQIEYSRSKTFKSKYSKKTTVSGKANSSVTIKKLKKSKKYYLRIRVYKKVNGKKIYSSWSDVKTKKTK